MLKSQNNSKPGAITVKEILINSTTLFGLILLFFLLLFYMEKERLFKNLYIAYLEARRHKRHTHSQMMFESNLSENLLTLRDDIYN